MRQPDRVGQTNNDVKVISSSSKFGAGHYSIHHNGTIMSTLPREREDPTSKGFFSSLLFLLFPRGLLGNCSLVRNRTKVYKLIVVCHSPVYINDLDRSPRLCLLHFSSSNIHPVELDKATQLRPPTRPLAIQIFSRASLREFQ